MSAATLTPPGQAYRTEYYKSLIYKAYCESPKASKLWTGNDFSNKTLINESGLYSLILASKLPQARVFKHWRWQLFLASKNGQRTHGLDAKEQHAYMKRGWL